MFGLDKICAVATRNNMSGQKRLFAFSLLDWILTCLMASCYVGLALCKNEIASEKVILRTSTPVTYIAVDPESNFALAIEDGVYHIINLRMPSRLQFEYGKDQEAVSGAITANGKTAALVYKDGSIHVWENRSLAASASEMKNSTALSFLDSDRLLVLRKAGKAKVWKFRTGEIEDCPDSIPPLIEYPPVDLKTIHSGPAIIPETVLFQRSLDSNRVLVAWDTCVLTVIQFANYDYARRIFLFLMAAIPLFLVVRRFWRCPPRPGRTADGTV